MGGGGKGARVSGNFWVGARSFTFIVVTFFWKNTVMHPCSTKFLLVLYLNG